MTVRKGKKPIRQSAARIPARAAPVRVPVSPQRMWKILIGTFAGLAVAGALVWAALARMPERAALSLANATSRAGFVVRQVEIEGVVNQPKLAIYREVLSGGSDSMLLIDLPATRERLRGLPWVNDASVARRWPDRLEVSIVERRPAAIWQNHGRLTLIDRNGEPLPSERLEEFVSLPLVVGANANREAAPFLKLLAKEPALADKLKAAVWIGDRRWDLKMTTGETLSLPEGDAALPALRRFVALDRQTPLLGRGFIRFDMRIPDKLVVRVGNDTNIRAKVRERMREEQKSQAQNGGAGQVEVVI